MEKLSHTEIEKSDLYLNLSGNLLSKIDRYLSNVDLTSKQRVDLIKLIEEACSETYVNALID